MGACGAGQFQIVKLLLKRGANFHIIDNDGDTPLHWSCLDGSIDIVQFLIDKGCDIHKRNNDGKTPLMLACEKGHLGAVHRLIAKGFDKTIRDKEGNTTLHLSCYGGNISIVKLLINSEYDIHESNNSKQTALFTACSSGFYKICELLMSKAVSANTRDDNDETPLTIACEKRHPSIVRLLLEFGNVSNANREKALQKATSKGFENIVSIITSTIATRQKKGKRFSPKKRNRGNVSKSIAERTLVTSIFQINSMQRKSETFIGEQQKKENASKIEVKKWDEEIETNITSDSGVSKIVNTSKRVKFYLPNQTGSKETL